MDIVKRNKSVIKPEKGTLRPFSNFPPDPKLVPTNPILLDIVSLKKHRKIEN